MPRKALQDAPSRKKLSKATFDKARRKKLEKELEALWSKVAHKQWGERCAWPGCTNTDLLSPHHFWHQAQGNIAKYSVLNSILLCFGHHIRQVHQRGNTEPIREVLIQKIGHAAFDQLRQDVKGSWTPSIDELERLKSFYEEMLSNPLENPDTPDTYDDLDRVLEEVGL